MKESDRSTGRPSRREHHPIAGEIHPYEVDQGFLCTARAWHTAHTAWPLPQPETPRRVVSRARRQPAGAWYACPSASLLAWSVLFTPACKCTCDGKEVHAGGRAETRGPDQLQGRCWSHSRPVTCARRERGAAGATRQRRSSCIKRFFVQFSCGISTGAQTGACTGHLMHTQLPPFSCIAANGTVRG